ncbi:D-tyrosyl-tRNA(Tyr) deacylase [Brevibacillus laterosporus]|uniref:D-aminoacyl-tRNA deacylase n=1 Tax=Brevibacillus laterosporus TaxID=1465 RepID=A0A502IX83_BRELA|nr:D-aminoacyl-tRNA deacylase [Brevibacillus laterosporus]QDX93132.1 D-tyrosyl-tRNA(Tyr) deacylase [Brevibacillus laterosporus]RAP27091.1 D-tyrosyl-tRNA(Tyr) deacylase [Brevibacillus laterosporus]TPG72865.1 D-tyrosyl-tRNA(Tyr) deacylase [Brevibacillus laterosporus]TPG91481.1 D-tyrosyl-tRNA(Tyr) deacylase [Brevibacillus laterosporus]
MRVVVQKAKASSVSVNGDVVGQIERGLVLLVGITHEDTMKDVEFVADKVANLRIFEDEEGKMNYSVKDTGGQILSISQFTLYGDCRKGRRPNFMSAARPEVAEPLYDQFNEVLRSKGLHVETGRFGAMMDVQIYNHGPVTLIVES